MTYGSGTMDLANALDAAHHQNSARRRSLRAHRGNRMPAIRRTVGAGLVAVGELLIGSVEPTRARAGPSRG